MPSIQHSGTHFILRTLGGNSAKLKPSDKSRFNTSKLIIWPRKGYKLLQGHFDYARADTLLRMSRHMKTVIPLRHPALIAVSWKKRGPARWRSNNFLEQWLKMCEVKDAFYFPLETMPFDELEDFTGLTVNRTDRAFGSIGDYPEKRDLKTARDFLGDDWALVEEALETQVGRKFYSAPLCGLR